MPVALNTVDPRILIAAAQAAKVSDYPNPARTLMKAAQDRSATLS
jgi:hypothetical protein